MRAVVSQPVLKHWGLLARWGVPVVAAALVGCTSTTTTTTSSTSVPQASVVSTGTPSVADAGRRAQIRLELAANYYQAGRMDVAMEEVGQALSAKPDYADAYGLLGLILMQNQDWGQADIAMRKAIDLNPRDGNQIHNYGWMLCQQKRFDEAQPCSTRRWRHLAIASSPRPCWPRVCAISRPGSWIRPTKACFVPMKWTWAMPLLATTWQMCCGSKVI